MRYKIRTEEGDTLDVVVAADRGGIIVGLENDDEVLYRWAVSPEELLDYVQTREDREVSR